MGSYPAMVRLTLTWLKMAENEILYGILLLKRPSLPDFSNSTSGSHRPMRLQLTSPLSNLPFSTLIRHASFFSQHDLEQVEVMAQKDSG